MRAHIHWFLHAALALIGFFSTTAISRAQTAAPMQMQVSIGTGWSALWDDETMLGRGAPVTGGVGWLVSDRLLAGAEVEWFHHTRDSGYLAAAGDAWTGTGRATWLFGRPGASVRATAGAGVGVMKSTGTLTFRSILPGPQGLPVAAVDTQTPWSTTGALVEVNGGVRIGVSERLALRPEVRWRTGGGSRGSGIEPPFLGIGAVVRADIALP